MITLDEVIKAFEECIVPKNVFCNGCYKEDRCKITEVALHYLKEYQRDKQIFAYDIAKRSLELSERNDPLTWDELKQMVDSIVWLEWSSDGNWAEIIHATDDEIEYFRFGTDELCYIVRKDYEPDKWQAYRKERDEEKEDPVRKSC